ncbi:MAG: hypothetical protein LC799_00760, partial [Actinobacteria bacterium]|nr:hypothetical protein [Actinomycetota bacterium]
MENLSRKATVRLTVVVVVEEVVVVSSGSVLGVDLDASSSPQAVATMTLTATAKAARQGAQANPPERLRALASPGLRARRSHHDIVATFPGGSGTQSSAFILDSHRARTSTYLRPFSLRSRASGAERHGSLSERPASPRVVADVVGFRSSFADRPHHPPTL